MGAEANATWLLDKAGYETGYCCINATLRDYARFGMLLANYGALDGKQIIPADWVKAATTAQAPHLRVGAATAEQRLRLPDLDLDPSSSPRRRGPFASRPSASTAKPSSSIPSASSSWCTPPPGPIPTTAPSAAPNSSCSKPSSPSWKANDLRRQAEAPSPDPAEEQARLHAPRLRGQGQHPVRRLRPRLHQRRADPGLLGARHPAAPRRQALRHRLQLQDPRLLPRQQPRLQHRPRPHALASSPAPTSRTASSSTSASPATATPPPSASASSPTSCAAA